MRRACWVLAVALIFVAACSARDDTVVIGAVYPVAGGQGPGGIDEYRGVRLAAELANDRGGVRGRRIALRFARADSSDQAPRAVGELARAGVQVVVGSHGSTISRPAADAAARAGRVFWETGAVGELGMAGGESRTAFRFAPTGATLGGAAVDFARDVLLPRLRRDPRALRYAAAYVDDEYGRAVGRGSIARARAAGMRVVGDHAYRLDTEFDRLARSLARARVDVLFVAAYLDDGVALRRALVRNRVPLVASVGTSSSYCMHEFGEALGKDAVGLFASDKPDGHVLEPGRLAPEAGEALRWARATFRERYGHELTANALTGFAGAWALFRHVLPAARGLGAAEVARAARAATVEVGHLPNGSGLDFDDAGSANLRATSVIWEWVRPGIREVVWPPSFATHDVVPIEL